VNAVTGSSLTSSADAAARAGRRRRIAARTRLDFWFDAVLLPLIPAAHPGRLRRHDLLRESRAGCRGRAIT
jgi:hypothetical protein